jgi:hypothetical protein
MKAKRLPDNTVKLFFVLPNAYSSPTMNCVCGFDTLSKEELESEGFFDLIDEPFNTATQTLSEPVFDNVYNVFRRYAVDIEINAEDFRNNLLKTIKREAGNKLQLTDWQVTRFTETGTPVDPEVLAERQRIRNRCNIVEAEITALATAEELLMYEIVF